MTILFDAVIERGIAAVFLIVAVVLARLCLKRSPKWITCLLWALVAFRLVSPVTFVSAFSLVPAEEIKAVLEEWGYSEKTAAQETKTVSQEVQTAPPGTFVSNEVPGTDRDVEPEFVMPSSAAFGERPQITETEQKQSAAQGITKGVLTGVWIAGVIGMLFYAVISYLRLYRNVRECVPLRDNIFLCDAVQSPFVLGFLRPRILLFSGMEPEHMEMAIAHEKAHIRRLDHLWKLVGYLILAVYWFHPLCWAAYLLFCKDLEFACDERVIRRFDEEQKKLYSKTLVVCNTGRRPILTCPVAFGEVGVEERVKAILHYRKPAFWVAAVSLLLCVGVGVCFVTVSAERSDGDQTTAELPDPTVREWEQKPDREQDGEPDRGQEQNQEQEWLGVSWDENGKPVFSAFRMATDIPDTTVLRVPASGQEEGGDKRPYECQLERADWQKIAAILELSSREFTVDADKGIREYQWMFALDQDGFHSVRPLSYLAVTRDPEENGDYLLKYFMDTETLAASGISPLSAEEAEQIGEILQKYNDSLRKPDEQKLMEQRFSEVRDRVTRMQIYEWEDFAAAPPDQEARVRMAVDPTGEYEIYGIQSRDFGWYGLMLNHVTDAEPDYLIIYKQWFYDSDPEYQPKLLWSEDGERLIFSYVVIENNERVWKESVLE